MPVSTRLLAPFLENRKSESTTATVATFQHAQAEKSRESQLSQGASLKTEIVTKPKVAGVATVAGLRPENQNYGNGEQAPPAPAASIEERRASV
jgi:hypothetical protein